MVNALGKVLDATKVHAMRSGLLKFDSKNRAKKAAEERIAKAINTAKAVKNAVVGIVRTTTDKSKRRINSRATRMSRKKMLTAAAALDEERAGQLEELAEKLEVKWRHKIKFWEEVRAPIHKAILCHMEEQKKKLALDPEHVYEELPEIKELMRVFPFRVDSDLRDKFGNVSVILVPHCGVGSSMAADVLQKMEPKHFERLFMYQAEYMDMLLDRLTLAEGRL